MAVKKLDNGRIVFSNASHLYVTPYTAEDTIGTDTYDIRAIVADSISIEQDDNNVNTKDWEFGNTPLFENIILGNFQFSATCIDFQNDILTTMFGCDKDGDVIMFPSQYEDLYVAVRITFKDSTKDIIIPKLKLNSKAVIGTLKTGSAEGTLSGTAYATGVVASGTAAAAYETPLFIPLASAVPSASPSDSVWQIQSAGGAIIASLSTTEWADVKFAAISYAPAAA